MNKNALGDLHLGETTRRSSANTIYKPRNARTEHAWRAFLDTLKDAGLAHVPGTVHVIREDDFSHEVEIVPHAGTTPEGAQEYYRRCGCLLCLTWLLGAYDLHVENLIANGDTPVLVDLETLMSGAEERRTEMHALSLAGSVTSTHLLPHFDGDRDGSGFSGDNGQNIPHVDGRPASLLEHLPQLLEGFEQAFRFVFTHKDDVCQLLHVFDDCTFRIILRPTSTYGAVCKVLAHLPETQRAAQADRYMRIAYERDIDPDRINKVSRALRAEVYALTQGWIPLFYTHGNSVALCCDGRQLGEERGEQTVMGRYLKTSPIDTACERIRSLDEQALIKQMAIIRMTYHAKEPLGETQPHAEWCSAIMTALKEDMIPGLPSSYMQLSQDGHRGIWVSAGWTLYDGLAGIMCALAAMGQEQSKVFQQLYAQLDSMLLQSDLTVRLNGDACGLGSGVSGIISCLVHIGELTGNTRYTSAAYRLLECFTEQIALDAPVDVLGGLAGLCLQLPKLPGEQARRLARVMLTIMRAANTELTGAGHGKAGIALALGALQRTLGSNELDERILTLLHEENDLFVAERNNWPDLRIKDRIGFMGGWCAGAPGIGMCRKRLLSYTSSPEIIALCQSDIQRVQAYLSQCKELQRDTLCCGNAARLLASEYLSVDMPELWDVLSRSAIPSAPRLFHLAATGDHQLSLMQGMSGVGYALAMYGNPNSGGMLL